MPDLVRACSHGLHEALCRTPGAVDAWTLQVGRLLAALEARAPASAPAAAAGELARLPTELLTTLVWPLLDAGSLAAVEAVSRALCPVPAEAWPGPRRELAVALRVRSLAAALADVGSTCACEATAAALLESRLRLGGRPLSRELEDGVWDALHEAAASLDGAGAALWRQLEVVADDERQSQRLSERLPPGVRVVYVSSEAACAALAAALSLPVRLPPELRALRRRVQRLVPHRLSAVLSTVGRISFAQAALEAGGETWLAPAAAEALRSADSAAGVQLDSCNALQLWGRDRPAQLPAWTQAALVEALAECVSPPSGDSPATMDAVLVLSPYASVSWAVDCPLCGQSLERGRSPHARALPRPLHAAQALAVGACGCELHLACLAEHVLRRDGLCPGCRAPWDLVDVHSALHARDELLDGAAGLALRLAMRGFEGAWFGLADLLLLVGGGVDLRDVKRLLEHLIAEGEVERAEGKRGRFRVVCVGAPGGGC